MRHSTANCAAIVANIGKVRLGGMAPTLASADAGKVRLGGMAPTRASTDKPMAPTPA